jgi:hypothetical protein
MAYSDGGDYQSLVLEALHNLRVGLCEISGEVHPVLQAPGTNLSENLNFLTSVRQYITT